MNSSLKHPSVGRHPSGLGFATASAERGTAVAALAGRSEPLPLTQSPRRLPLVVRAGDFARVWRLPPARNPVLSTPYLAADLTSRKQPSQRLRPPPPAAIHTPNGWPQPPQLLNRPARTSFAE